MQVCHRGFTRKKTALSMKWEQTFSQMGVQVSCGWLIACTCIKEKSFLFHVPLQFHFEQTLQHILPSFHIPAKSLLARSSNVWQRLLKNCSCAIDAIYKIPGKSPRVLALGQNCTIQAGAEKTPGRIEKLEHAHLHISQVGMSAQQRECVMN